MTHSFGLKFWVEVGALVFAGASAGAAAYQSAMLSKSHEQFVQNIRFEHSLSACVGVSSSVVKFGREIDSYVRGASISPLFEGTQEHADQIDRVHYSRLEFDGALEVFLIVAPDQLHHLAKNLLQGSSEIHFATNITNLALLDSFTTDLGKRLDVFRDGCRSLAFNTEENA